MEFNSVGYCVLGIPAYFFCAFIGFVVATSAFLILVSLKKYDPVPHMKALMISVVGLILCSRLFGCLSGVYRAVGVNERITIDTVLKTGIVFYGGLIGMLITYVCCIRSPLIRDKDYHVLDVLAVTMPLFHTISRVGCFLGGCCFGKQSDSVIPVLYTTIENGVVTTEQRIPIQLIEAAFNLCLFLYLLYLLSKQSWRKEHILYKYLLIYSVGRFLLEFGRGDTVRGLICGVSFSQVISVMIWLFVIRMVIKNKEDVKWEQ